MAPPPVKRSCKKKATAEMLSSSGQTVGSTSSSFRQPSQPEALLRGAAKPGLHVAHAGSTFGFSDTSMQPLPRVPSHAVATSSATQRSIIHTPVISSNQLSNSTVATNSFTFPPPPPPSLPQRQHYTATSRPSATQSHGHSNQPNVTDQYLTLETLFGDSSSFSTTNFDSTLHPHQRTLTEELFDPDFGSFSSDLPDVEHGTAQRLVLPLPNEASDSDEPNNGSESDDEQSERSGEQESDNDDEPSDVHGDRAYMTPYNEHDYVPHGNAHVLNPEDIDEASPSEDERNALQNLHQQPGSAFQHTVAGTDTTNIQPDNGLDETDAVDILQEHRRRNHANRAPRLERLAVERTQDYPEDHSQADNSDSYPTQKKRAPRHSKGTKPAHPTTLSYYPGRWQEVQMRAKKKMGRYIFLHHAFPDRETDLHVARNFITEVLAEFEREGQKVEDGYEQTRDMNVVVFKEASTYRGTLKTMARPIVREKYKDMFDVDFEGGNQMEYFQLISHNVEKLLKDGYFLQGGVDNNNKTNNLSHSCIEELCIQFFYVNKNGLARLFPDDFKEQIPDHAVAIVMASIQNCIEEFKDGYYQELPFNKQGYNNVVDAMLGLIEQARAHAYHGPKYTSNVRRWARVGMRFLNADKFKPGMTHRLKLVLD
ncbi:hypothetical protein Hypma_007133 [Hypsizygus marmoreus]|uniref:DUF6532 domain-containing protein n=1 Tax=Hypsizygus marmoreus TaxID=39966 RepID=A0A369K6R7_HYPMA|nr:hypothetical protein Hypma_007133 [Hypsizygus marmoreus]